MGRFEGERRTRGAEKRGGGLAVPDHLQIGNTGNFGADSVNLSQGKYKSS
jgi:hypothetical protein